MLRLIRKMRLARANRAVAAAREVVADAMARRDSRAIHGAIKALADAQHARLRVELGWR